jgi:hypothetical protein
VVIEMQGPYLNLKDASTYCGYKPRTFSDIVKQYNIPKYGPRRNKFSVSDLDIWMQNTVIFMQNDTKLRRNMMKIIV